jgi:hypothetical protein
LWLGLLEPIASCAPTRGCRASVSASCLPSRGMRAARRSPTTTRARCGRSSFPPRSYQSVGASGISARVTRCRSSLEGPQKPRDGRQFARAMDTKDGLATQTLPFSCHAAYAFTPKTTKPPGLRGFRRADDGTRTHDLLHGKCWRRFAAVRAPRSHPVSAGISCSIGERARTRANAECCHCCHCA